MDDLRLCSRQQLGALDVRWPDVYFSPGYGAAVELSDAAAWEIAIWRGGEILYPYLRRTVEASERGAACFDLVSPYGYAGTWVREGASPESLALFRRAFRREASARGYIAEFQRLHPLLACAEPLAEADPGVELRTLGETLLVPLAPGYDAWWSGAEGRCRTAVRKARGLGYQFELRTARPSDLHEGSAFRLLYEATMTRAEARPYYHFPDAYYERLATSLGEALKLALVRAADGRLVAAALFLVWPPFLHYHLAGSERDAARDGVNNFLLDRVIAWGVAERLEFLHLGGGLQPDDALFRFKLSFGGRRLRFQSARTILEPRIYAELVSARALATGRAREALLGGSYFPAYRG